MTMTRTPDATPAALHPRGAGARGGSRRRLRRLAIVAASIVAFGVITSSAEAAITVTRAELNGSQLRVEGSGALPNATVVVNPGAVSGRSDSTGAFRIESTPYRSSTCQVTVSDGSTSASASLSGCTPSTPPPPPPPTSAPAVSLSPTSLTFASRDTGTTSPPQLVTVTNTGTASLFINSAAVPNTLDFTVVNDGCSGLTLAVGTGCSVSITFSPTQAGTRSAQLTVTDNAPNSPQTAPLTGTGTTPAGTTAPVLAINTQFMTCTGGVCDIGAGSNVFVNNFFTTTFLASNGTPPYRWSGTLPAGLTLRPSGLALGAPTALGTSTFQVTVSDAAGATATGTFSLAVTNSPPPTPPGCQTGGNLRESLSGPAFGGQTPSGEATADESQFSGCGGFSLLSAQVKNVNLPDGTVLWVTLDFKPVGTITLRGGAGTMAQYNMGRFGVSRDAVRVYSALPDISTFQQILIGGAFQ
jgi:Abnormal spindle-like microcephaly-assoc'd, ASPM-SPD-2-Hydin/Putative Ig domain